MVFNCRAFICSSQYTSRRHGKRTHMHEIEVETTILGMELACLICHDNIKRDNKKMVEPFISTRKQTPTF